MPVLGDYGGDVLICCGDMPLVRAETYAALAAEHEKSGAACTVLSGVTHRPLPFGRVLRDGEGGFDRIVEDRDCTPEQKKIRELNSGILCVDFRKMASALRELRTDNAQHEYYLTDLPVILKARGEKVRVCSLPMDDQLIGVNTPAELSLVEEILKGNG